MADRQLNQQSLSISDLTKPRSSRCRGRIFLSEKWFKFPPLLCLVSGWGVFRMNPKRTNLFFDMFNQHSTSHRRLINIFLCLVSLKIILKQLIFIRGIIVTQFLTDSLLQYWFRCFPTNRWDKIWQFVNYFGEINQTGGSIEIKIKKNEPTRETINWATYRFCLSHIPFERFNELIFFSLRRWSSNILLFFWASLTQPPQVNWFFLRIFYLISRNFLFQFSKCKSLVSCLFLFSSFFFNIKKFLVENQKLINFVLSCHWPSVQWRNSTEFLLLPKLFFKI